MLLQDLCWKPLYYIFTRLQRKAMERKMLNMSFCETGERLCLCFKVKKQKGPVQKRWEPLFSLTARLRRAELADESRRKFVALRLFPMTPRDEHKANVSGKCCFHTRIAVSAFCLSARCHLQLNGEL